MITASVTCWEYPGHTLRVVECLKKQSVPVTVWVWDNGCKYMDYLERNGYEAQEDAVIQSEVNFMGYGGLLPLGGATTEYCLKIDDDIKITDPAFLEKGIAALKNTPGGVCCVMGRNIPDAPPYYPSKPGSAEWNVSADFHCDLATGQCMLFRTEILEHVPMRSLNNCTEEDITLSLYAPGRHIVPASWTGGWENIPKSSCISQTKGHWERREQFMERNIDGFRRKAQG